MQATRYTIAHTASAGQATTTQLYVYPDGFVSVAYACGFNYQQFLRTQLASTHGKARRVLRYRLAQAIKYNF